MTGVNEEVIVGFRTVLSVLHCGLPVDWAKFHAYAVKLYRRIVELYPWYYVPSSVHSILLHGAPIMSVLPLAPSFYDEGKSKRKNFEKKKKKLRVNH